MLSVIKNMPRITLRRALDASVTFVLSKCYYSCILHVQLCVCRPMYVYCFLMQLFLLLLLLRVLLPEMANKDKYITL